MPMFKKFFLGIVLITISCISYADSASTELNKLLSNAKTIQADFTQSITNKEGKVVQQSEGRMALERPGKFRWEVKKPTAQLVIANGSRLWIYDPDLEQVTIRTLEKGMGETPALLLSNSQANLEDSFKVEALKNNVSTMRWFLLKPNDQSSMFTGIQVGFLNNQLHAMKLEDHLGNTTEIRFDAVKFDVSLASSLFTFNPPKKIDVIDETKPRR